ncbi:MAG: hypothetical protein WC899_08515 [bacterium]|jgi:hypothetical protein
MKRLGLHNIFVPILLVGWFCNMVWSGEILSPEDVLDKYMKMDMEGYRIYDNNDIYELTDWNADPGYDVEVIIRGYKRGKTIFKGNKALIRVRYDVVGFVNGGVNWEPYDGKHLTENNKGQIDIIYELIRKNGKWKIRNPNPFPHISLATSLAFNESQLPGPSGEPEIQKDMKNVVNILRGLSKIMK